MSPLATPYPHGPLSVEVKDTGTKGLGVFATRNIQRGQVCCWYDGIICHSEALSLFVTGSFGYSLGMEDQETALAGFRDELRPGGCAQLCNDASTEYNDGDLKYLKHINVTHFFYENGVAFKATKRIQKGEELLYSYGSFYWEARREREYHASETVEDLFSHNTERVVESDHTGLSMEMKEKLVKTYSTHGRALDDYMLRYSILSILEGRTKLPDYAFLK